MAESKDRPQIPSAKEIESLIKQADSATYESIPNKIKPQVLSLFGKLAVTQTITQFSGPLPPPEEMAKYEQIVPGSADRLIAMAERQSEHRMKLETYVIQHQQRQSFTGQWLGFAIAVVFLIGSVFTTIKGFPWVGGAIGGTTIVSLVTVFVLGRNDQKKNLSSKNR